MMTTYSIEYQVADALTEVGEVILSREDESKIAGRTHCRLRIIPKGKRTLISTEVLVSSEWLPVRPGASDRLLRAMFCLIAEGGLRRPYGGAGEVVIDLGYLEYS
jgi:hypothetical protein